MRSPLDTFAGLLDRSIQEIATLAADARAFDAARIGSLADIWDNNTFPLVSAACAARLTQARRARDGLLWMADLGPARRALMVDLDATLDRELPAAAPRPAVHRDYLGRVYPGSFPVTTEIVAALAADYDLANAVVRSIVGRPAPTGLRVDVTLAALRRFVPSTGRVASDGSRKPWPAAPLRFTFVDVAGLCFDAVDRVGIGVGAGDAGLDVTIGHSGTLRATSASVWPDEPRWYESAAGRAADAVTSHEVPDRRSAVPTASLTSQQRAAARALTDLMLRIRLAGYYPELAGADPLRTGHAPLSELCRAARRLRRPSRRRRRRGSGGAGHGPRGAVAPRDCGGGSTEPVPCHRRRVRRSPRRSPRSRRAQHERRPRCPGIPVAGRIGGLFARRGAVYRG